MILKKKAVLVPGFSESEAFASAFAEELTSGENAIVDDIDIVPVGIALRWPESYRVLFNERLVVTHSAGLLAVNSSAQIMALNAPERNTIPRTGVSAIQVAFQKDNQTEDHVITKGFDDPAKEIISNFWSNMTIPFKIRNFSSAHKLAHGELFPEGRFMFQTNMDEFKFTRTKAMDYAAKYGVHVAEFEGYHNYPMFRPMHAVANIRSYVESIA